MKENNKAKLKVGQIIYISLAIMFLLIFITVTRLQKSTTEIAEMTINNARMEKNTKKILYI